MKSVDGEEYLNTEEAIKEFGVSRQSFYDNARPYLQVYRFDAKRTPWYRRHDVRALKSGKPVRRASIAITGMFADWTEHARSLGYNVQTVERDVEVGPLPRDIAEMFRIPVDQQFVRRGRMTFIDGTPICHWSTYYPAELVDDILDELRHGSAHDIVEHIREKRGIVIGQVNDTYSTRITTFDEQNLFHLLNSEPVLVLQRVALTADQKILVLFSDMTLLGNWFVIKRTEKIHHWDK